GTARNVRMKLKRAERRPEARLLVELIEHPFPDNQGVVGIARIAMAVGAPVAEGLARQLDQLFLAALPDKRQIVSEGVAVPEITLLEQEFETVGALRARAPAEGPLLGAVENHVGGPLDHVALFVLAEIARHLVMVAVAGHFVSLRDNRRHRLRVSFRDAAAGEKRRLHFVSSEDTEDSVDPGVGTVLALGVFFVVDPAVFVRLHVFPALKIET